MTQNERQEFFLQRKLCRVKSPLTINGDEYEEELARKIIQSFGLELISFQNLDELVQILYLVEQELLQKYSRLYSLYGQYIQSFYDGVLLISDVMGVELVFDDPSAGLEFWEKPIDPDSRINTEIVDFSEVGASNMSGYDYELRNLVFKMTLGGVCTEEHISPTFPISIATTTKNYFREDGSVCLADGEFIPNTYNFLEGVSPFAAALNLTKFLKLDQYLKIRIDNLELSVGYSVKEGHYLTPRILLERLFQELELQDDTEIELDGNTIELDQLMLYKRQPIPDVLSVLTHQTYYAEHLKEKTQEYRLSLERIREENQ